jgi:riboflavin kinase / FMN adenylyltransferase
MTAPAWSGAGGWLGPKSGHVPVTWHGLAEVPHDLTGSVAVVGVFDGVHRGHQAIIARAHEAASAGGLPTVVVTFDPHPITIVRPDLPPPDQLVTLERRIELLHESGADAVCVVPFTRELAGTEPDVFVSDVLVGGLRARRVVVGADFRFGHRAAGNVALLAELGERLGFTVDAVPLVPGARGADQPDLDNPWSSTVVRRHLADGDVSGAEQILGRPHRVEGVVVHGDHRGRELGFPTANLDVRPFSAVPADGVYSGWLVRKGGETFPAAISIGTNPTFDGSARRVEAYVLDRDDLDLYGEQVAVDFARRLRGMERFDSVGALVEQMDRDVADARAHLLA